jgi:hypothetical protein
MQSLNFKKKKHAINHEVPFTVHEKAVMCGAFTLFFHFNFQEKHFYEADNSLHHGLEDFQVDMTMPSCICLLFAV